MEANISNFQYLPPRIEIFSFVAHPQPESENKNCEIKVSYEKEIKLISKNEAEVKLGMVIGSEEDDSPFDVQIMAVAKFRWDGFDKDTVKTFLNQNAFTLIISFIRPIIATFTSNAGFSPFYLPLLNFTEDEEIEIEIPE